MNILAVIPARSGSKSVPHKNIREICGKPMMAYSIEHALASKYINRVIVSTDSMDYADIAKSYGAEVPFIRPEEYATDTALDLDVFKHALGYLRDKEGYDADIVVQLRPTYPIRRIEDIDRMIEICMSDDKIDSVRSMSKANEIPYKMWLEADKKDADSMRVIPLIGDIPECYNMPRQQLPEAYYQNACIDVFRPRVVMEMDSMSGRVVYGYKMKDNFDIDTEEELIRAERYIDGQRETTENASPSVNVTDQSNAAACMLCGCSDTELIDSTIRNADNNKYKMYRCKRCETHFIYPRPMNEQLEEYYDGKFRSEVHSDAYYEKEHMDRSFKWFSVEAIKRVERVKDELKTSDSVLEIGCSIGYFMKAVSGYVDRVYGTEWDRQAEQYVRDTFPEFTVSENPSDFGVKFDKIFMFHVLEHIENPVEFLSDLKKLLNPGGTIYIEVPNVDDVLVKTYKCKKFLEFYYKLAHIYNFNEKGMRFILDNAGLKGEIEYIQRYDLSNHMVWLGEGVPKGQGRYNALLGEDMNKMYVEALKKAGQTDTLFVRVKV